MNGAALLSWYNAIFFVPMAVSALLLALSSLRFGGNGHGHARGFGHGHTGAGARSHGLSNAPAHSAASPARHSAAKMPRGESAPDSSVMAVDAAHHLSPWRGILAGIFGVGRAPLIIVGELFFLAFGLTGMLVNGTLLHSDHPAAVAMLPSIAIALAGGIVFARLSAAALTKIMPDESTAVLSRESLFGLSGTVAYPVSQTGGRVHLYDEFGTFHDESCRVAPGQPQIARGQRAKVVDVGPEGRLIVEESV